MYYAIIGSLFFVAWWTVLTLIISCKIWNPKGEYEYIVIPRKVSIIGIVYLIIGIILIIVSVALKDQLPILDEDSGFALSSLLFIVGLNFILVCGLIVLAIKVFDKYSVPVGLIGFIFGVLALINFIILIIKSIIGG